MMGKWGSATLGQKAARSQLLDPLFCRSFLHSPTDFAHQLIAAEMLTIGLQNLGQSLVCLI
jgi:hypothetical protein